MIRPKSMQQRLALFVLLPVALLLAAMGLAGFIYARKNLLIQWRETATLMLQRAANLVDTRLARPKELLALMHQLDGGPDSTQVRQLVLQQIQRQKGVAHATLTWKKGARKGNWKGMRGRPMGMTGEMSVQTQNQMGMMAYRMADRIAFALPHYDPDAGGETVALISDIKDSSGRTTGRLQVHLRFDYLMDTIEATGWWHRHKAFLVNADGIILASTLPRKHNKLAQSGDELEKQTLEKMKDNPHGTIFGRGFPPAEIASFYKLREAPWALVIIAPGRDVLASILHFRGHYFTSGIIFILIILLLIRQSMRHTVASVKEVSHAAEKVAKGHYGIRLPVKTRDEVGELIHSFNRMVIQLEERAKMKTALNLAMDLQRSLLPRETRRIGPFEIAGKSLFCDETGGDYYDFLQFPELGSDKIGLAVGDVSGHGIAAALLMTTARALVRSRIIQDEDLSVTVGHVNRLLCQDTVANGDFMTLFLAMVDIAAGEIRWVRAGHDPAVLYDPANDKFIELAGKGMALGIDENHRFVENRYGGWDPGQILLISTDGLWETENPGGERFGKKRLQTVLSAHRDDSAEQIIAAITREVDRFRGHPAREDDLTLVVMKRTDK